MRVKRQHLQGLLLGSIFAPHLQEEGTGESKLSGGAYNLILEFSSLVQSVSEDQLLQPQGPAHRTSTTRGAARNYGPAL
eukprot:scaffold86480_cov27-Tisochrysis_lutea.AAC.5